MTPLLIVLGAAVVWLGTSLLLAMLTGGMIHEREMHERPRRRSRALAFGGRFR